MVFFAIKNTDTNPSAGVKWVDIQSANAKGGTCKLEERNGYGGLSNAKPVDPGKQVSATAVLEVTAGEKVLTLTYRPYGSEAVQSKVR